MTSWPLFMISFFTVIMMVQIIIIIRTVHDGDQELYKVKGIKFMFFLPEEDLRMTLIHTSGQTQ